jgi:hypothetical protein
VDSPLVSIDAAKDPSGGKSWYAGRVYAPSVTFSNDGKTATMIFSGYAQKSAAGPSDDYRQIGRLTLRRRHHEKPVDC